MNYIPLDAKSVIDYIKFNRKLSAHFSNNSDIVANEIGNGNINYVFLIKDKKYPSKSIIIKQALPYLRVAGESWPLTKERNLIEYKALQFYEQLTPGFPPKLIVSDPEMCLFAMEFLGEHQILRDGLLELNKYPKLIDDITTFLSHTLFFTSDFFLPRVEKERLHSEFSNTEMTKVQQDLIFTNPFKLSPENNWNRLLNELVIKTRTNNNLKVKIADLKDKFQNKTQALIHSDLHTGSIMVNKNETRIIDPEFLFFGPMGFDIAALIQNLCMNYLSHYAHTADPSTRESYQSYLFDLIISIWKDFKLKFENLWINNNFGNLANNDFWDYQDGNKGFEIFRNKYINGIFNDMVGFAGIKMLRRTMGFVSIHDYTSIKDTKLRASIEEITIIIGTRWILENEKIRNIDDMINILLEESRRLVI